MVKMSTLEKSLISQFIKLGCTQQEAAAAYQVFMELTEVRRLFNVNYHFDNNLKRMYFTAKNSKSEEQSVFVPICTFENVSFSMIKQLITLSNNKSCYLAIISPDSTCVYYEVSDGLIDFTSSTVVSKLSLREKHDNEISQKRDEIEQLVNKNKSDATQENNEVNVNN